MGQKNFRADLIKCLKEKGLTPEELGDKIKTHKTTIYLWLKGEPASEQKMLKFYTFYKGEEYALEKMTKGYKSRLRKLIGG